MTKVEKSRLQLLALKAIPPRDWFNIIKPLIKHKLFQPAATTTRKHTKIFTLSEFAYKNLQESWIGRKCHWFRIPAVTERNGLCFSIDGYRLKDTHCMSPSITQPSLKLSLFIIFSTWDSFRSESMCNNIHREIFTALKHRIEWYFHIKAGTAHACQGLKKGQTLNCPLI